MTEAEAVLKLRGTESNHAFGARIGISANTANYWLRGEAPSPRMVIKLMAEARRQKQDECYQVLRDGLKKRLTPEGWSLFVELRQTTGATT